MQLSAKVSDPKTVNERQKDSKIYVAIVKQLRLMIERDGLKPGDKLPSERELSERLIVGRSSVREALRALELLGLIETRRGEGTFIRDFKGNQLVQLLSTFVLQDEKAKKDVIETKHLIEMDCLILALYHADDQRIDRFKVWAETADFTDDEFFYKITEMAENHLFQRIWSILNDYYHSLITHKAEFIREDYLDIIVNLISRDEQGLKNAYCKLRKLSKV